MAKRFILMVLIICVSVTLGEAQQTAFTYQGKLTDSGAPANGNYDLQFDLWDASSGGNQMSSTKTLASVPVSNGVFTVTVDFGAGIFNGGVKFLEIAARPTGTGSFTVLTPRQPITSTPYAVRSLTTATADLAANAQQLGGIAASEYVRNDDARLADARTPAAGSENYIQNGTSLQAATNFNIGGDGKAGGTLSANVLNAATQFNINGSRAFAVTGFGEDGPSNTFAGTGAGAANTPSPTLNAGNWNSFFGAGAGATNTTGFSNSFFGVNAGNSNVTGGNNSFFGVRAGRSNTTGFGNAFFGHLAGDFNSSGDFNSFFGVTAGRANTTGASNAFFGHSAGGNNLSGSANSFFGPCAGCVNGFGSHNSFFGENTGSNNLSGDYNTLVGANANGGNGLANSTALGAYAQVTESNSLVLGSINGVNGATADTKVGIGTTAPIFKLQIVDPQNTGLRVQTNTIGGTVGSFGGLGDFKIDSNSVAGGRFTVRENGNVGIGTNIPDAKLDVAGKVRVGSLGAAGITQLCQNNLGEIANCSSSLRYKTAFRPFTSGLNLIKQLHPLTFSWKSDQSRDLGLGAEDVAAVEPLLVTRNANGEVEGVKYDRLSAVFINAFKEQQNQIEQQRLQIGSLLQANAVIAARLKTVERRLRHRGNTRRRF